jgi:hypothetical protein
MGVSELLGVEMTHGSSSLDEKQVTCRIPFLQYKTIHVIDLNQFPLRSATSGQTTFKAPPSFITRSILNGTSVFTCISAPFITGVAKCTNSFLFLLTAGHRKDKN